MLIQKDIIVARVRKIVANKIKSLDPSTVYDLYNGKNNNNNKNWEGWELWYLHPI